MSAAGAQAGRRAVLVEIETDGGITGIGEAGLGGGAPGVTQAVVERLLKPMLVGQDPLLIERLWQTMFERSRAGGPGGVGMPPVRALQQGLWGTSRKDARAPPFCTSG